MSKRINLLGCPIDTLTLAETEEMISQAISDKRHLSHAPVNASLLVYMQKDKELRDSIVSCNIINADGQAVVWASRFLGQPLPERAPATELMQNLIANAKKRGYTVFFLGAQEEIVSAVVDKYTSLYGSEIVAGYRNGYFGQEDEEAVARQISDSGADILFVAISSPKKEVFLDQYREILNTPFTMGVGGAFDVVAGKTKRAPRWMQDAGLEWFFRLIQEPRRMWKRYFYTNTMFIYLVLKEKLFG